MSKKENQNILQQIELEKQQKIDSEEENLQNSSENTDEMQILEQENGA